MNKYSRNLLFLLFCVSVLIPSYVFGQEFLQRVNRRFIELKPLGNYELSLATSNGRVKILGKVNNLEMKNKALSFLKEEGVTEVEDLIVIDSEYGVEKFTDEEIKINLEDVVKEFDQNLNKVSKLEVKDGNVFLVGDFQSFRVVDELLAKMRTIKGVKDISTQILVQSKPYLSDVTKNY
jgi:osmotically-inducible protein OsmY